MYKKGMSIDGIEVGHVQGIATDAKREFMYYSCTTFLAKTDMEGNIIGTVKGLAGHLGCIAYNFEDGRVYGSLEYKNDAIGSGILRGIRAKDNKHIEVSDAFYVAIFDVDRIDRMDMDAEKDGVMKVVFLNEVLEDYLADGHRYGCSGIDGITFAPAPASSDDKLYAYVAYGVYGDVLRNDNDYQVLLRYDTSDWSHFESSLSQDNMPVIGPEKPDAKYFVYTGNTCYGIQNLEYDKNTGYMFAAVYEGEKEKFPNYPMYVIDLGKGSKTTELCGIDETGDELYLADIGEIDDATGIRGINFPYGSTGMISLGDGYFYFSEHYVDDNGKCGTVVGLYEFDGDKTFVKK